MTEVLIFGAGFLGHRLNRHLPSSVLVKTDITDIDAVRAAIRLHRPAVVINAAAKTGVPNVDWAETHQVETFRVNVTGALHVAEACAESRTYLLHIGSGCVYYGRCAFREDGWHEEDPGNPHAFYTRSKYAADLMLSQLENVGIARVRLPLDGAPHTRNLITKLAHYTRVIDVENSVTVVDDFLEAMRQLVLRRATGVFHVTNPGIMRHRELLRLYTELVDPSYHCELISATDLVEQGLAVRPRSNTVLSSQKLLDLGIPMRHIDVALEETMRQYARALRSSSSSADSPELASRTV